MSGEYSNDGWQPLCVAEIHERCAAHKLTPLTTATLTELFPGLLPIELRQLLEHEPSPSVRATLIDIAVNQSFRRDVFCRGAVLLTPVKAGLPSGSGVTRCPAHSPPLCRHRARALWH